MSLTQNSDGPSLHAFFFWGLACFTVEKMVAQKTTPPPRSTQPAARYKASHNRYLPTVPRYLTIRTYRYTQPDVMHLITPGYL